MQEALFKRRYTTEVLPGRPWRLWEGVRWYQRPGTAVAAVPGTSNHGWGLAVDVANVSASLGWLTDHDHALDYGWSWEIQSEPWHIRYTAGDKLPPAVLAYEEGEDMGPDYPVPLPAAKYPELGGQTKASFAGLTGYMAARLARLEVQVGQLVALAAADETRDAAALAAITALANAGGVDAAPIVAAVREEAATTRELVTDQAAEITRLRAALVAASRAEADALEGTEPE